jgi:tetratricopeptide (TPR) repeat protein
LCGQLQKPTDTALILARTAETCLHLGRMDEAREHCGRALELTQLGGPKARQAAVENTVGRVHRVCAEYAQARERHKNAHKLAIEIEHRFEMAMALNGLAEANRGMGESGIARDYLSKADALFEQMGILGGCRWPTPGDLS